MRIRTGHIITLATSLPFTLYAGCTTAPALPSATSSPAETAMAQAPSPKAADFTTGTVVETMPCGGYTCLCIENSGARKWAAIPLTEIRVGQEVELAPGIEMRNFTSKTLDRTFESIQLCPGLVSPGETASAPALPAGHPTAPGMPAAVEKVALVSGKVVETMEAGGYTYLEVEKDDQRTWVAVPPAKITVGADVSFIPGTVMRNFTSKTLNRTFESIIFSGGIVASSPEAEKPAPPF
ncbi:MAG: hypothetical protein WDA20_12580 [Desulfuromonadales bacterium]